MSVLALWLLSGFAFVSSGATSLSIEEPSVIPGTPFHVTGTISSSDAGSYAWIGLWKQPATAYEDGLTFVEVDGTSAPRVEFTAPEAGEYLVRYASDPQSWSYKAQLQVIVGAAPSPPAGEGPALGVISDWTPASGDYETLPQGCLALINPENGVFEGQSTTTLSSATMQYQPIVARAASRGVRMLGYVPTGYFDHSCNINGQCQTIERIGKQVAKYFELFPALAGIFFDETSPKAWDCGAFVAEFAQLRQLVRKHSASATISFNSAVPDNCVVQGASEGEIVVLYEAEASGYGKDNDEALYQSASYARSKGVESWHLVQKATSSELSALLERARRYQTDLFYATDIGGDWQHGDNTWGSPPVYWDELKDLLHKQREAEADTQL